MPVPTLRVEVGAWIGEAQKSRLSVHIDEVLSIPTLTGDSDRLLVHMDEVLSIFPPLQHRHDNIIHGTAWVMDCSPHLSRKVG